eukprot:TRINITY_DN1037_c0_g1_i6.p1 TRINITY_DN1037_c0_g1~~TRINITY_DN1037_c0_g1_i6.p1  ORF type:complete len:235 (-),score=10.54 TRINITY_DN1037_c0_g1_i6:52-756(-)
MSHHPLNEHKGYLECVLSAIRGIRNGIVTGIRIRLPYIMQALIYAVLFRDQKFIDKTKFVIKQMLIHGRNLGLFVFIYKSICCVFRQYGISNGLESWVAGYIGGYYAFGGSDGIPGEVNNQIVLYLFARGVQGFFRLLHRKGIVRHDVKKGTGFRIFAGFSLALILYMTEYQSELLTRGFMATMNNLYYDSDKGVMLPPDLYRFMPFFGFIVFTLVGQLFSTRLSLTSILSKLP